MRYIQTGFFMLFDIIEYYCTMNIQCSLSKVEVFISVLYF